MWTATFLDEKRLTIGAVARFDADEAFLPRAHAIIDFACATLSMILLLAQSTRHMSGILAGDLATFLLRLLQINDFFTVNMTAVHEVLSIIRHDSIALLVLNHVCKFRTKEL